MAADDGRRRRRCLLVTSVGGHVGEALLDALDAERAGLRIVGVNSRADAAANFRCDTVHLIPETGEGARWGAALGAVLAAERPDLVIPARDGDLEPLAQVAADPAHAAIRFWCPGPVSAAIVVDKAASAAFARAHGLPFVETALDRAGLEAMIAREGFPLVAKPLRGTGARGIVIVSDRSEAEACLAAGGMAFQPFLDPPADLARLLPDRRQGVPLSFALPRRAYYAIVAAVTAKRAVQYLGATQVTNLGVQTMRVRRADDPDLRALALAYGAALAALDYAGILNIQCLRDRTGRALAFELNGRVAGGVATRATLGIGEAPAILAALHGVEAAIWPPAAPPIGTLERSHAFHTIPDALVARLGREGVWHRPSDIGALVP